MSSPEGVIDPETVEDDGSGEDGGGLTAGQIEWLNESKDGKELVEQVLNELLGEDEEDSQSESD